MRLRSIALTLASATVASGLTIVPAHASTAHARAALASTPATSRPGTRHSALAQALAAQAAMQAIGARLGTPVSAVTSPGIITGLVTTPSHAPLTGACVVAAGKAGSAMAMTKSDGRYVIAGLRPGSYTLHFSDCSAPGRYLDQWSGGASLPVHAALVTVTPGQVRAVARVTMRSTLPATSPARLAPATGPVASTPGLRTRPLPGTSALKAGTGAIAGTVTGRAKPLAGICVAAFPEGRGRAVFVKTGKHGTYRAGSLAAGRYIVRFYSCSRTSNWLWQYYKGLTGPYLRHRPTPVVVTAGKTTGGIDAALRLGGEIDGTVRSAAGRALAGICVWSIGRAGRRFVFGGFTKSDSDGSFALHALYPASYRVQFSRGCGNQGNYAPVWWRHSLTMTHATQIPIAYGTVVKKVDVAMLTGGVLTGVVRGGSPTGSRLGGICVSADARTNGSPYGFAMTASDGRYRIVGLTTSRYRVTFIRCRNHGNYLSARSAAQVTLGHTTTLNTFLPVGAIVTGVVKDGQGNPISGICVSAEGHPGSYGGAVSGADGSYTINALRTGSYAVGFSGGCRNSGSYAPQYYNGQANIASANLVSLTAGQTTSGIGATMQPGGTVTGTVTDTSGHNVNTCVILQAPSALRFGDPFFGNFQFSKNGVYTARNLAPGLYAASFGCFGSGPLARQWFRSQSASSNANFVSVPAGVITSGISAVLQPAGSITGSVTDSAGKPLSGICVQAVLAGSSASLIRFFGPGMGFVSRGHYTIRGLAAGSYDVQFSNCGRGRYGSQWYKGQASLQAATPVSVTAGGTTSGIDAVMTAGGSISGQVTDSSGHLLPSVCVIASDSADRSFGFSYSNRTGSYTITSLSTGSYQVSFFACGRARLASLTRPGMIQVTAPHTVTGVNATLSPPGTISGTVLGGTAATPQAGVCVVAVPVNPDGSYAVSLTGNKGQYKLSRLGAGQYQVSFGDPFCPTLFAGENYAPQWYNGQSTQATATDVTVKAGADTGGIGATLASDGGISGTVTAHAPVAGECVTAYPVNATPDPVAGATLSPVIAVTAADGSYNLVDLLPGQYKVEFSVGCGDSGFADQWWRHARSEQTATVITVSANATVTGIDARLHG
ncbi:MAG TPA: carboxypeptidase-like regulatory domain-containing protein [Streptosporangiaceae bacterium]